jgi:hypothetical protein
MGTDFLCGGMRGCAEQLCFDRVGEERSTADDGQEVKRCIRDGPYPSGREEPSEKAFDSGAQRVDEAFHDEAHAWAVDRSLVVHDPQDLRVCRREDHLPDDTSAQGCEVVE